MEMEAESISMDFLPHNPSAPASCFHHFGAMIILFFTQNKIRIEQDGDIFRKFFTSILDDLCSNTVPSPELSLYFLSHDVITASNREIWERKVTELDKNYMMYEVIIKTKQIFHCVEALKRTSNESVITFIAEKIESYFQCSLLRPTRASGPCSLCLLSQKPSESSSRYVAPAVITSELASPITTSCVVGESLPPNSDTNLQETTTDVQNHQISNQEHSGQNEQPPICISSSSSSIDEEREPCLTQEADVTNPTFASNNRDIESGSGFSDSGLSDQSNPFRQLVALARKHRNQIFILGCLVLLAVVSWVWFKSQSVTGEALMLHTSLKSVTSTSNPTEIPIRISPAASASVEASILDQRTQAPSVAHPSTTTFAELLPTTSTEFVKKGRSSSLDLDVTNDVPATFIFEIDNPARNPLFIPASKNDVTVILKPTRIYNWTSSWDTKTNTDKVTSLILKGKFNMHDIVYFLDSFKNLVKLEISDGKLLCICLDEFDFDTDTATHVILNITHLIISNILQPCNNLFRLFTRKIVQIPNLRHLTLENASIQHENIVLIEKLFQMYESSIQSLSLTIILCSNCILFESRKFSSLKNGTFNVNPRYSATIWTTLENLSVASPNVVTFNSNVQCLQKERNILKENWANLYINVDVCG